ncbi:MAG: tetratricopeptide repeat protein [Nitrospirota bacterium]
MKRLSLILLLFSITMSGCSLPKIVVLHDPLSADEHLKLGSIYASQGKTLLARDQFQAAAKLDPKNTRAWSQLGDAAYILKDYDVAERAYDSALDLDPKNGDLYNNLAWVFVQQETKFGAAHELVMKALGLNPANRPYYLDTLGCILLKEGNAADAVAALEESVRTIPQDQAGFLAEAYLHLAEAYRKTRNEDRAGEAMKHHLRLRPPASTETAPIQ